MNVLIPRQFPGKFYYPPCKCDLINQIRYYNPKTREFYYHKAYTAVPPPLSSNTDGTTYSMNAHDPQQNSQKGPILAGEPEFYPVPAFSANSHGGGYINPHLPASAIDYLPSNQYYKPYMNHHMVIRITGFTFN